MALRRQPVDTVPVESLLAELGERSFGWTVLFFALVNLLPLPFGSNMITAIPLLLLTVQMALGYRHVTLPAFISRRHVPRDGLSRLVLRLKPLFRPVERIIRPRRSWIFQPRYERTIGLGLLVVATALFLPIPFSGWVSAGALAVTSVGLIERDGVVTLLGLALGGLAVTVTLSMAVLLLIGVTALT